VALAKTAMAFSVPVIASTSATKVYSGPLIPRLRAVLTNVTPIERRRQRSSPPVGVPSSWAAS